MTEEDLLFFERVTRSLRGDLSPSEQEEFKLLIESDPAKRAESEQLIVTHDLLSLCAATDAPPRDVPQEALKLLRLEVEKHIKRKPAKWKFGPATALWASGIAAALIIGIVVLEAPLSTTSPQMEYRLQSNRSDTSLGVIGFGASVFDWNKGEPFESVLRRVLDRTTVQAIEPSGLPDWENNWPESNKQPVFKVLIQEYGLLQLKSGFGLVRVMGRWRGANFQKTFQITTPDGLPKALREAQVFIEETIQQHSK